jgi:NADH:ubiquinone oxidoreductase subunit E
MQKIKTMNALKTSRDRIVKERKNYKTTVVVCGGTGCQASRSQDVISEMTS